MRIAGGALLAAAFSFSALAAPPLPLAKTPEEVGLSSTRLARLEATTRANVAAGVPAGAVILIARDGRIAFHRAIGDRDRDAHDPMRTDAIFRLYSMTKPIVSVAIMQLVEEGRVQLADPVSMYLPEMKGMKVGVETADASGRPKLDRVDAAREMTIQDLLRHTSGLVYPGGYDNNEVNRAYNAAGLLVRDFGSAEFVTRLSKMPLRFSPGTRWEYGVSTDVLGRVLEVIEKRTLAEVLESRILGPLGMTDTAFFLPAPPAILIARSRRAREVSSERTPDSPRPRGR